MIVNYHAALSSHPYTLPYFTGLNVTGGIPATQVCVSDPSLMLTSDLKLAWYTGNNGLPFQHLWQDIVSHLQHVFDSARTIHFGASGGGFAALFYAHDKVDSMAIVVNPQTRLDRYTPRIVQQFARLCFDTDEPDYIAVLSSQIRSDVTKLYSRPFRNTVVYLQNLQDSHTAEHLIPFIEAAQGNGDYHVHLHDWGPGHVPPPQEFLKIVLRTMSRPNWAEYIEEGKYLSRPSAQVVARLSEPWRNAWNNVIG